MKWKKKKKPFWGNKMEFYKFMINDNPELCGYVFSFADLILIHTSYAIMINYFWYNDEVDLNNIHLLSFLPFVFDAII